MSSLYVRLIIFSGIVIVLFLASSVISLPDNLFNNNYSTVLFDRNDKLLAAKLSDEEQWRFKSAGNLPEKFTKCLITYEDKYFYYHPGINIFSIISAALDNLKSGKVIRGGSTLSMQLIRLSRKGMPRTYYQKLIESYLTLGLELSYSKDSLLSMYCSNAPMGGNIIGLEAASWRYFGHSQHELSWAEAATLAVLPNAPSLIHPGKNRKLLLEKRNGLLKSLYESGDIDKETYNLAILERIPDKPKQLPQIAYHLLQYYINSNQKGELIKTTLDIRVQKNAIRILDSYRDDLIGNEINNAAVLIVSPINKEVLAYVGNFSVYGNIEVDYRYNDMIRANRSTGSILKPFLYAAMINDGSILPNSLIRDIPSYFDNYYPENYTGEFHGALPASEALSQSLNVPSVYMLQEYGIPRFMNLLNSIGFSSFTNSADHYGLSLILGGGETSLYQLVNAYSGMAQSLIYFDKEYGSYPDNAYNELKIRKSEIQSTKEVTSNPLSAASIWLTYKALKNVSRPISESGWEQFVVSPNIAWKTGTSHGFKDAWAIGSTSDYVIGVWAGNADGKGRKGLSGTATAAPIMFELYRSLPERSQFYPPYDELAQFVVCKKSGEIASRYCNETDTIYSFNTGITQDVCKYHKLIFLDSTKRFRVNQGCYPVSKMQRESWFVLPPVQEFYYSQKKPNYKYLPEYMTGCNGESGESVFEIVYPLNGSTIYIVRNESEEKNNIVMEVKHNYPSQKLYWHIDNTLIGISKVGNHKITILPDEGDHRLTVVDENGNSKSVHFTVINHG